MGFLGFPSGTSFQREVPLDFANNDGYSPLDLCVRKSQPEVGDQLVAAGAKMVKELDLDRLDENDEKMPFVPPCSGFLDATRFGPVS